MPKKKRDWLSGSREDKLARANNWVEVLTLKAVGWKVPMDEVTGTAGLGALAVDAKAALAVVKSADKTATAVADCKAAFKVMIAKMRSIKKHYFLIPPLTAADLITLGLKPPDPNQTPQGEPVNPPFFELFVKGYCQVGLLIREEGAVRFAIPDGVDGAVLLLQIGGERPSGPDKLPSIKLITRARSVIPFEPEDVGKPAYISLQWQNGKGEKGLPAPMQEIVVP
jgi:hypothetical protein